MLGLEPQAANGTLESFGVLVNKLGMLIQIVLVSEISVADVTLEKSQVFVLRLDVVGQVVGARERGLAPLARIDHLFSVLASSVAHQTSLCLEHFRALLALVREHGAVSDSHVLHQPRLCRQRGVADPAILVLELAVNTDGVFSKTRAAEEVLGARVARDPLVLGVDILDMGHQAALPAELVPADVALVILDVQVNRLLVKLGSISRAKCFAANLASVLSHQ